MSLHGFVMGAGLAVLSASAAGALVGCSGTDAEEPVASDGDGGSNAATCQATLPPACEADAAPSYAGTIAPLVERTCLTCHAPGGVSSNIDLTTYANLARLETTDLVQLYSCQMPPADAGADATLSLAEREELIGWITCGYPDN